MRIPLAVILATLLLGAFASPTTAAEGPARVVVVPAATLGEVREIFVKRLNKKIRDVLAFAGRVKVLKAEDRLPKPLTEKKVIKKPSKAQLQLAEADRLRLEGMDFYGKAKFKRAYRRFLHATQIYEKYFYELVDYNNLADAYARAAVAASRGGLKKHDVKFLFTNGLSLQPTLVIDRRKAPAKLLEMFDSLVAITKKAKRKEVALVAKGDAEGAIAYVDGHRVGPLPGRRGGLLSGYHYVQVRSPNHKPWGKQIRIRSKNVTVKIKLKPIKKKKVKAPPKPLTFADLGWCKNTGSFHDNGQLKTARLAHPLTLDADDLPTGALVAFQRDGATMSWSSGSANRRSSASGSEGLPYRIASSTRQPCPSSAAIPAARSSPWKISGEPRGVQISS